MAQLIVRNLEEAVKNRLRRRANRHGRSMEEEAREILRNAVRLEGEPRLPLGSQIHRRFAGIGFDQEIPTLRGRKAEPARFEK